MIRYTLALALLLVALSEESQAVKPSANVEMVRRSRNLQEYSDVLVDGTETLYDEYAQAWRMLGLYVDCSDQGDDRRQLEDAQQDNGEDDAQEDNGEDDAQDDNGEGCKRYVLWAAYVDVNYEGRGSSEYKFLNPETNKWDDSNCGDERCVKMDCHLPSTNFKLLGFFKDEDPVTFMSILTENGGGCIWGTEEYNVMANKANALPQGCTATGTNADGKPLYLDLKPKTGGGIDIGVYTDALCSVEYTGNIGTKKIWNTYVSNQATANYNNDDDAVEDYVPITYKELSYVNKALGSLNTCQPCRSCNEANQCSVFAQNGMTKASYADVALARQQGAIQRTFVGERGFWARNGFLVMGFLTFLIGIFLFVFVTANSPTRRVRIDSQPLMGRNSGG